MDSQMIRLTNQVMLDFPNILEEMQKVTVILEVLSDNSNGLMLLKVSPPIRKIGNVFILSEEDGPLDYLLHNIPEELKGN